MGYGDLSHAEVIKSHKAKLKWDIRTRTVAQFYGYMFDKAIFYQKAHSAKQHIKVPFSTQSRNMGLFSMAISQSDCDKFL